jgi:hypothetical protein
MPASALIGRAVLEARKSRWRHQNWHPSSSKVNLNDPKTRIIFIVSIVGAVVLILFAIGLFHYGKKERNRKKNGQKPRWGRMLLKSLALATLIAIPIWLVKKCRQRSSKGKGGGKYNKLDDPPSYQQTTTQTQWYGNGPAPTTYVGAGPALHGNGYGDFKSPLVGDSHGNGPAAPLAGSETYDSYGAAVYAPPRYDPPASLPDRAVSPPPPAVAAAGFHQPPPPEGGRV